MTEEILKAIPVFLSSALKFILGPIEGYIENLHFVTTFIATVGGMMFSVVAFTYFGDWLRKRLLRRFFQNKDQEEKPHTRFRDFIIKYGLGGVAFLTPLFLTPIGGTIIAVSMGKPKNKIIIFMLISAMAWALVFTFLSYWFGPKILKWLDITPTL
jgi:membrane protein DedA with SNARE-associated domain